MTERDYDNLRFLLSASDDELNRWYETLSDDDVSYALSLLAVGRAEMIDKAVDLMSDLKDACMVLNQFTLHK